jgi:ferrous iron transport protein A
LEVEGGFKLEVLLRNMKVNQKGVVTKISCTGEVCRRIRDIGIAVGAEIVVSGRAPLYDPVAVKVNGSVVTLRNSEADSIFIALKGE